MSASLPAWWSASGPSGLLAIGLATVIAAAAWHKGSLRPSGAIAAAVVGAIALRAGWSWGGFLIVWFAWVTLGSRLGRARKAARTAGIVEKGGQRDATQVMANGGLFALAEVFNFGGHRVVTHATDASWRGGGSPTPLG